MIKKQGISLLLSLMLVFSLCSCGQKEVVTTGTNIELLEPVNVDNNTEKATRRTMYDAENYAAIVYPTVTEYSFSKDMSLTGKGMYWGESVDKGDVLVYGDTEDADEQIEKMQEQIAEMDKSMTKALESLNDSVAEPKEELKRMKSILDNFAATKPAEKVPASSVSAGDSDEMIDNPEYLTWKRESELWTGKYRILEHNINMQEESYRQRKELYDLERAYLNEKLTQMKKDRNNCDLTAKEAGEVVALNLTDRAQKEQAVVAVGNMQEKVLKSDFINTTKYASAKEIYALIDGKRYEVKYHPVSNEEYTKLTESGVKVYTEFTFLGDYSDVKIGDYASICVLYEKEENALTVPVEAIHKDGSNRYVYVMKDGETVMTPVTIGYSDGVYTIIKSGLEEGADVLIENAREVGKKTARVTYGSFHGEFKESGRMASAITHDITNPVEYGTTYFGEYKVQPLQHVEKGDVIATVRVVGDELSIQRKEQQLKRANERLADLRAAGEEDNEEAIEAKLEEISEIEEMLQELRADAKTTEIKSTVSGMITALNEYEPETILYKDSYLVQIADESTIYISVEDSNNVLNYGNKVEVSFSTWMGQDVTCIGTVANVRNAGLGKDLQNNLAMIMVDKKDLPNVVMARTENWRDPRPYVIKAVTREMDNVLVVPRSAVTETNGVTYVNVMDEQGNVKACSFVAGGYDNQNYWIIEGLSEGMVVCLK